MNKLALTGCLAVLVAGSIWVIQSEGGESDGMAVGMSGKSQRVWQRLGDHQGDFLRAWKGAFSENPKSADPNDVLDAFNEMAVAVTGPTGFWRDQVGNKWYGCAKNGDTGVCQALSKASGEFTNWDDFQDEVGDLNARQAARYIARHHERLMGYLDRYVPAEPTETAMRKTSFYAERLKDARPGKPSKSYDSDEDEL